MIELLAKDKNGKLQFEGRCKLTINSVSKLLLIEPLIEEFKMISALFKWSFVAQKNILFIFAEHDFQDCALIFDNENTCTEIFGFLLQKGAIKGVTELIRERLLSSVFDEISENHELNSILREILVNSINQSDERADLIQLLKDKNIFDLVYANEEESIRKNLRKRKVQDITRRSVTRQCHLTKNAKNGSYKKRQHSETKLPKIIEPSNFEIQEYYQNGIFRKKLVIFPSSEKEYCYEYGWRKSKNDFECFSCSSQNQHPTAKLIQRNGKDVLQTDGIVHVCQIRKCKKWIENEYFEVLSVEQRNTKKPRLIIFLDSSRVKCYEYSWQNSSNSFYCCGCAIKHKTNSAHVCRKKDGTEFVILNSNKHVCKARIFDPEKYGEKEVVQDANFKLFKNVKDGINKSKIALFASSDKTDCYEYYWNCFNEKFICHGCSNKNKSVTAEVYQNSDGSNYLKLSRRKHICVPREYDPAKMESQIAEEIVQECNFKIFHYQHKGETKSDLVVFCHPIKIYVMNFITEILGNIISADIVQWVIKSLLPYTKMLLMGKNI